MSLRINTNVTSLAVQNAMRTNNRSTERSMKNLATGSRIAERSSDVAGGAIADQMNSDIKGMESAKRNAESAVSFANVAEGALNEQTNILMRMRELSVQAASDNYSSKERTMMNGEYVELKSELDRIAKTTRFGSQKILDGSVQELDFQVGTTSGQESRISYKSNSNTTGSELGIDGLGVESKDDARDSMDAVDKAMSTIGNTRAKFGALQSRLDSAQNNLATQVENISAARSQIADADLAKETTDVRRGQIIQQYQTAMLQEANNQTGLALKLIG